MDDELTQDELGLIACAIRYGSYPPRLEYLPDCERLVDRGWLDRELTDDYVCFSLSTAGATALELGGAVDEATASTN
jgi:hypothetical protein